MVVEESRRGGEEREEEVARMRRRMNEVTMKEVTRDVRPREAYVRYLKEERTTESKSIQEGTGRAVGSSF
jgi:hypothetical protein